MELTELLAESKGEKMELTELLAEIEREFKNKPIAILTHTYLYYGILSDVGKDFICLEHVHAIQLTGSEISHYYLFQGFCKDINGLHIERNYIKTKSGVISSITAETITKLLCSRTLFSDQLPGILYINTGVIEQLMSPPSSWENSYE